MAKFKFRFEKVLQFRSDAAEAAKREFMEARARTLAQEAEKVKILERKAETLKRGGGGLADRLSLLAFVDRLDGETTEHDIVLGVLRDEEEAARQKWITARQEFEAIEKLRANQFEEWNLKLLAEEQKMLDEFAIMRRGARCG